jgi:hypothetical protein
LHQKNKTNNNLEPAATDKRHKIMNTPEINFEALKKLNFAEIEISEPNLRTYIVEYYYKDCNNLFSKHILAESLADAVYDAMVFIETENAKVADKPKSGNYIEVAFVREWFGKKQAVINF